MGDRAHAVIKSGAEKVYLYTHWQGSDLAAIVKAAIKRVPGRWQDPPYLARAVFCEMLDGHDIKGETGFGIAASPCEDTSRDIIVDIDEQRVTGPSINASFADFIG